MGAKSTRLHYTSFPTSNLSSPPPYKESADSRLIITETTTTTEVVTTTTTKTQTTAHFLSSSPWKRPGNTSPSTEPPHRSTSTSSTSENGVASPALMSTRLRVDKDLPPTPSDVSSLPSDNLPPQELAFVLSTTPVTNVPANGKAHRVITHLPPSLSRKSSEPFSSRLVPQATQLPSHSHLDRDLAQAVPHVTTSPDVNTIDFVAFPPSPSPRPSHLRRTPSAQRPKVKSSYEPGSLDVDKAILESRRNRGLSLGTTLFGFVNATKKEEHQESVEVLPTSRSLSRKPSLWFRKKTRLSTETSSLPVSPVIADLDLLRLPELHPVSPLDIDLCLSSADGASEIRHVRTLSRSHSERVLSSKPATAIGMVVQGGSVAHLQSPARHTTQFPVLEDPTSLPNVLSPPPSLLNRPRAQTNPPFLHRLSTNLFSSSSFPSAPNASPSVASPRSSLSPLPLAIAKPRIGEESPEAYLNRVVATVSKSEVMAILASSGDPFHVHALQSHIERFNFHGDPLDVALRKLLMHVALPRETQQIDRVIEAFAKRYRQCNPSLFSFDDHPYILAFSLIMLHTDAFNKSNKRKMTKADYIKNTRLPGVATEVLDCFYDNIVFAPFIFIEDPLDVNGQGLQNERTRTLSISPPMLSSNRVNVTKGSRVDPYYLIAQNLLDPLRVDIESHIPSGNPFSYEGTSGPWKVKELQQVFATASVIEVASMETQRNPSFTLAFSGSPNLNTIRHGKPHVAHSSVCETRTLKVAKAGVLNRKDDILEGGRKATNRKWKLWSVILTGSQLLLFRDPTWTAQLLAQPGHQDHAILPEASILKPEEFLTVRDVIAVYDRTYSKHPNTMRLVMPDGRHILLRARDDRDLNEWVSRINYASAFKSAGVRMRAPCMSTKEYEMTGVAAATSHLHDTQHSHSKAQEWDGDTPHVLMDMLTGTIPSAASFSSSNRRYTMVMGRDAFDFESPAPLDSECANEFKSTFEEVKAQLASGDWRSESLATPAPVASDELISSPTSVDLEHTPQPSRIEIINAKIRELEAKIVASQTQLDVHLRLVRNIATLTPFRKSTRDTLETVVRDIAKDVMKVRLDLAKSVCHREILTNDLLSFQRDLRRARSTALKAATETLQGQEEPNIPRMMLSFHHQDGDVSLSPSIPPTRENSSRAESTCDSFHSALDFGPDWPSASDTAPSGFLRTVHSEATTRSSSSSSVSLPCVPAPRYASKPTGVEVQEFAQRPSTSSSRQCDSIEKLHTTQESLDEQAEEWNKTRAAQRVSLVRLPSSFRMSTLFEKHAQIHRKPGTS